MATETRRAFDLKAQISPGDMLGSDKARLLTLKAGEEISLGTVLGEVRGLSYRHNPQDDSKPSVALVGPFKFVPFDEARNEIRAMRCFLPNTVHEAIVAAVQGDRKPPVDKSPGRKEKPIDIASTGEVMPIVMEVGAKRTEGGVGYVYLTQTSKKIPLELADPLASLSARAGLSEAKALPPPKKKK